MCVLKWLLGDRRGLAASEFALTLPVLIVLLLGTVEIGQALLIDRKVTAAAQTAADLAAQARALDDNDIENLFDAIDAVISPFPVGGATYALTSVVADGGGNASVDWSERRGAGGLADPLDLPAGILRPGDSVIVAQVSYDYEPVFGDLIIGSLTMSDQAFLRPRRTRAVARD